MRFVIITALTCVVFFHSCKKKENTTPDKSVVLTNAPQGFPEIPFTKENPFTIEKWELGKKLFYDKMLSIDYSISCASCHKANLAFSDDVTVSIGAGNLLGTRNAPSLTNVAYHPYFTREGGVPTLEMQILVPIQEHNEFNFNILKIAERMQNNPEYVRMSNNAFGRGPDAYVITRAIGIFERTLVSGNSEYDKYINNKPHQMSQSAVQGLDLFFNNRTGCSSCHNGFNFTNYSFENNGLYVDYKDIGRERFTGNTNDNATFKVPSLRNIAVTAPYMHDGSLKTLDDIVAHYNSGGHAHPNKSSLIRPLDLTDQEQQDLVAFLESLTDYEFINNQNFYNNDQ